MAKARAQAAQSVGSLPTGKYLPCPMNQVRKRDVTGRLIPFHPQGVALAIQKGPKKHWIQCGCSFFGYLPRAWESSMGLTLEEARRAGLIIPSTV